MDHKDQSFTISFLVTILQMIQKILATTKQNNSRVTIGYLLRNSTKIMTLALFTQVTADYISNTTTIDDLNITYIYLNDSKIDPQVPRTEINYTWQNQECRELKIRLCILEIDRNETDSAARLFRELQDYENYTLIHVIIKQAYANDTKNVPKLVSFITKLPWCNHQYAGLEYLFNELKLNKELQNSESIQFAYRLKKFLDGNSKCLHIRDDKNLLARLKNLKNSFPDGIRFIIWNSSKLCVKSHKFNEFLFAAECCKYDSQRRRVFTWIPKGAIGTQGDWTFEPVNDAKFFRIKNEHYQEYLYAAECCKYDKDRRNAFTWIPKGEIGIQGEWELDLINELNLFKIRNIHYDEYLYAAACCKISPNDHDRRSVFTWIPKGDIGDQGEWEIAPCA